MNWLTFSIHLAVLPFFALSQHAQARLRSFNTDPDIIGVYKHDALIKRYEQNGAVKLVSKCSGTIITDLHVLTAAHCVVQTNSNQIIDISDYLLEVTVGITQVDNPYEPQIVRAVETIFLPANYYNYQDPQYFAQMTGDIALLKLNRGIGLGTNPNVEALKLPPDFEGWSGPQVEYYYSTRQLTTTGFGILGHQERTTKNGNQNVDINAGYLYSSPAVLRKYTECLYDPSTVDYKLCAELRRTDYSFSCGGDSGGSLIDVESKALIGVTSIGSGDCQTKVHSTFTRVNVYLKMIKQAIYYDAADVDVRRESFVNNPKYSTLINKDSRLTPNFVDSSVKKFNSPHQPVGSYYYDPNYVYPTIYWPNIYGR